MIPDSHPQNPVFIQAMFGKIARRYDLANHLLSMGLDYGWRHKIGRELAALQPARILDLATGSGDLALTLQRYCPASEVIAADFCLPMLLEAKKKRVPNLVDADGTRLPFADASFDALTISFGLRNMVSYPAAIQEFLRVLRPEGRLMILDFSLPGGFLREPYRFYLRKILPSLAGWLTGEKSAYDYLGESIEAFPRGEEMCQLISSVGGKDADASELAFGIVSLYRAEKK